MGHILSARSWVRSVVDLAWVASCATCLALLFSDTSAVSASQLSLALQQGGQRHGLYLNDKRLGKVEQRLHRDGETLRLRRQYFLSEHPLASMSLTMREDLSLLGFAVQADLKKLQHLLPGTLELPDVAISAQGTCDPIRGMCRLSGTVGKHQLKQEISVGRGPVLPDAVHPLLVQGALGRDVELSIFDPLSLSRRTVTYHVGTTENVRLASGVFSATRVEQEIAGLTRVLWLDAQGRTLREQLPGGIRLEHEAWLPQ